MLSFKKLICLFVILGLFATSFADTPGSSDGPSSEDNVQRDFKFEIGDNQITVEVQMQDGSQQMQMQHEVEATERGLNFHVEFQKHAGDSETQLAMRLRLFELIEYVPDATPGYQNETIVNTYSNWTWAGFVDTTPNSNSKVITLKTGDGIFGITLRINVPANGSLQFNPEDVKFDIELNTDLLRAAGWLNGTEVALKAALSTNLDAQKEHEDDSTQQQNAVNVGTNPDLSGLYLSWINYLECAGSNKVNVISSALRVDDSARDSGDDADSTAHVVAFAFINLNNAANGACIWDPVVGVDRIASGSASLIASWAVVAFAALYALF